MEKSFSENDMSDPNSSIKQVFVYSYDVETNELELYFYSREGKGILFKI